MPRDISTLSRKELAVGDHKNSILNTTFRCDRCGAQAYVRTTIQVKKKQLPLYWCSHHANEYEISLLPYVIEWYSETNRLVEDRKKGSEN